MVDDGAAVHHVPHFGDDECEISQQYFKPVLLVLVCVVSDTTLRIVKPVLRVLVSRPRAMYYTVNLIHGTTLREAKSNSDACCNF